MSSEQIHALVVDDSALMRNLVSKIIQSDPSLSVVGTAMNGRFALQKIETLQPEIIILDIEMPEMNGIEFLRERKKRGIEIPVIILSSIAQKGAAITMEALSLDAADFVMKPSGSISEDIHLVGEQLIELIRFHGMQYKRRFPGLVRKAAPEALPAEVSTPSQKTSANSSTQTATNSSVLAPGNDATAGYKPPIRRPASVDSTPPAQYTPDQEPGKPELIAIGISTGGPNALRKVFAELDKDLKVPIVVVQHMPAGFTSEFSKSLDRICPLEVKEAEDGDLLKAGRILICPGDKHLKLERKSLAVVARLDDAAPVNGHRPSVDVLFESVASTYGNRSLAIIMTGMGKDGAKNLGLIYKAGGMTLGQDEASSVVYGMPRVAFEYGYVRKQVSLDNLAKAISDHIQHF